MSRGIGLIMIEARQHNILPRIHAVKLSVTILRIRRLYSIG